MPIHTPSTALESSLRDSIDALAAAVDEPPIIVSLSDIHGYLNEARSALLTLTDHPDTEPVVVADEAGRLHWADNNYVLVFNGDLIDRGPDNEGVLELVSRLIDEAPPGRVRVTLGNHEAMLLARDQFGLSDWYCGQASDLDRRQYCEAISQGYVVAAYDGYNVTYAHAGATDSYDVSTVNDSLVEAATELSNAIGTARDLPTQRRLPEEFPTVLGTGTGHLKGPTAGLVWLDFAHLPADALPQVVGHTRHDTPQTKGSVYCQNVIRENLGSTGGEAVFVETPAGVSAYIRQPDDGVVRRPL